MSGYSNYTHGGSTWDGSHVIYAAVVQALAGVPLGSRVLDAGCGSGQLAGQLASRGWVVSGADSSGSGIRVARETYRDVTFLQTDFSAPLDVDTQFDAAVCVEVIEHVFAPAIFLTHLAGALRPGGRLVLTTPYHGYLKNLLIAASGKFDQHVGALWEGGHIKFWSPTTIATALTRAGFGDVQVRGVGRAPYLWKSMIVTATRA
jgi:2-polyprenyl-3-methyl-5-hydroxy-6-metoxy-1,4-benzoquinol methylase